MHKLVNNEKGIGLVEMIMALGVAVIVITAMVSLSVYTLRSSTQSELLFEGSKYANEYLERVRLKRDSETWATFINNIRACTGTGVRPSTFCRIQADGSVTTNATETFGANPAVTRTFTAVNTAGNQLATTDTVARIRVEVSWSLGGNTRSTYVYTDLSNWRNR